MTKLWRGRTLDSPVAQLVEHSKLNWEILGSFPSWGVLIIFLKVWEPVRDIYCHFFTKSHSSSLHEHLYMFSRWSLVLKVVSHLLMVRCTNTSHKVTGLWLSLERKDMDSPVAQLVEHSKLNWEVLGSFPSWGVLIIFSPGMILWETSIVTSLPNHIHSSLEEPLYICSRWTLVLKVVSHLLMVRCTNTSHKVTSIVTKLREEGHGFPSSSVGRALEALLRGPGFISQLRSSDHFSVAMHKTVRDIYCHLFTESHSSSLDEHL